MQGMHSAELSAGARRRTSCVSVVWATKSQDVVDRPSTGVRLAGRAGPTHLPPVKLCTDMPRVARDPRVALRHLNSAGWCFLRAARA